MGCVVRPSQPRPGRSPPTSCEAVPQFPTTCAPVPVSSLWRRSHIGSSKFLRCATRHMSTCQCQQHVNQPSTHLRHIWKYIPACAQSQIVGVPNRPIFLYADETNYTLIDRFGPDFWRLKSGQGSHWMSRTSFEEEESCGSLDTCTNSKRQQTVRTIRMHSSPANSTQSQYYHSLTLLTCRTIELSSPVGFLCLPRVA